MLVKLTPELPWNEEFKKIQWRAKIIRASLTISLLLLPTVCVHNRNFDGTVSVDEDDDDHLIANQRVMLKSSGARAGTEYKDRIRKVVREFATF